MASYVEYPYFIVHFIHDDNGDGSRSIEFIPSSWFEFDCVKGCMMAKYMEGPYEDKRLIRDLIKSEAVAPESWPVFEVKIIEGKYSFGMYLSIILSLYHDYRHYTYILCFIGTHTEATKRVSSLKRETHAFTTDPEEDTEAKIAATISNHEDCNSNIADVDTLLSKKNLPVDSDRDSPNHSSDEKCELDYLL